MLPTRSQIPPLRIWLALAAAAATWSGQPLARADPAKPAAHKEALERRPHGPPPEAFEACNEKGEGEACSVEFHERTLTGSCVQAREQDVLFCLPDELPPPPPDRELPGAGLVP
jgi:hypothetical protein